MQSRSGRVLKNAYAAWHAALTQLGALFLSDELQNHKILVFRLLDPAQPGSVPLPP